jgi:hypothetical protein
MRRTIFWVAAGSILALVGLIPVFSSGASPANIEKVIHSFEGGNDGEIPCSDLTLDAAGNLYGTTAGGGVYGSGTVFELKRTADGWKEDVLHSFNGASDGGNPEAGVILDNAGNLYGLTDGSYGGNPTANVFRLSPNPHGGWTESVLYVFDVGAFGPQSDLVLDSQGNLFGSLTAGGGGGSTCGDLGCGFVFELIPRSKLPWKEITFHNFAGVPDGAMPASAVVLDSSGNVYGTTMSGGSGKSEYNYQMPGAGTVYKLAPASDGEWAETVVYNFVRGGGLGVNPSGGFILASRSRLLGTTITGGDGMGAVFELTQSQKGWEPRALYRFYGVPDGSTPVGKLATNAAGELFGATFRGGKKGYGTVFELTKSKADGWTERILHSFTVAGGDGIEPQAGVVSDSHGHLYGTTEYGGTGTACGSTGCGTVYEITL